LLNVPPDARGLIHPSDSMALTGFKKLRDESFAENLLKTANTFYQFSRKELPEEKMTLRSMDKDNQAYSVNLQNFIVEMAQPTKINCIILREAIHLGQTIRSFRIVMNNGKKVVKEISGSSVGRKRILTFKPATITSFTVYLEDAKGMDNVINVTAYLMDEKLIEK